MYVSDCVKTWNESGENLSFSSTVVALWVLHSRSGDPHWTGDPLFIIFIKMDITFENNIPEITYTFFPFCEMCTTEFNIVNKF